MSDEANKGVVVPFGKYKGQPIEVLQPGVYGLRHGYMIIHDVTKPPF